MSLEQRQYGHTIILSTLCRDRRRDSDVLMVGIGLGILFMGYWIGAYGWSQIRGCNAGIVDLIIPGRYKGCAPDGQGAAGGAPVGPGPNPATASGCAPGQRWCQKLGTCLPVGSLKDLDCHPGSYV